MIIVLQRHIIALSNWKGGTKSFGLFSIYLATQNSWVLTVHRHHDTRHNGTQHNDIQHKNIFKRHIQINNTQHNVSVAKLIVVYADCRENLHADYAECNRTVHIRHQCRKAKS